MLRHVLAATLPLLLAACAADAGGAASASSAVSFDNAEAVEIKLTNFAFDPMDLTLDAGKPYAVTFTNVGFPHDFTAPEFFAAATIAPEDAAKVVDGGVNVAPGTSVTVHLIPAGGHYMLLCAKPGHADRGMTGMIMVI